MADKSPIERHAGGAGMNNSPILFSGPMIRAILREHKTMTRRISDKSKYAVGQHLWVRETWAQAFEYDDDGKPVGDLMTYYRADGAPFSRYYDTEKDQWRDGIPWCPSIFMPRALSRITLLVTGIKAERLQDISEEDAEAEGCERLELSPRTLPGFHEFGGRKIPVNVHPKTSTYKEAFAALWDSINGERPGCSWAANPWVWAYSFEKVQAAPEPDYEDRDPYDRKAG